MMMIWVIVSEGGSGVMAMIMVVGTRHAVSGCQNDGLFDRNFLICELAVIMTVSLWQSP